MIGNKCFVPGGVFYHLSCMIGNKLCDFFPDKCVPIHRHAKDESELYFQLGTLAPNQAPQQPLP